MTVFIAILNGLAAIPSILGYVNSFASAIVAWYVQRQDNETLAAIADAAALSSRATDDATRYAAAAAWESALSRSRTTAS